MLPSASLVIRRGCRCRWGTPPPSPASRTLSLFRCWYGIKCGDENSSSPILPSPSPSSSPASSSSSSSSPLSSSSSSFSSSSSSSSSSPSPSPRWDGDSGNLTTLELLFCLLTLCMNRLRTLVRSAMLAPLALLLIVSALIAWLLCALGDVPCDVVTAEEEECAASTNTSDCPPSS